jgi:hypothetical protein
MSLAKDKKNFGCVCHGKNESSIHSTVLNLRIWSIVWLFSTLVFLETYTSFLISLNFYYECVLFLLI